MQIIPGVLATTEQQYQGFMERISFTDLFEGGWVQIDFADNKFVQNQTVGIEVVKKYSINLNKEAHLMVENPGELIKDLKEAGFKRVICHFEAGKTEEFIALGKQHGLEVGVAINPETTVEQIREFLSKVDMVLVMSINPGFSGQEFKPAVLEKVRELVKIREENNYPFVVEMDGGLNLDNIKEVISAGVENLVMTSYLFKGDLEENVENIWEIIRS